MGSQETRSRSCPSPCNARFSVAVLRATEKFPDCKTKRGSPTACTVEYQPVYFVNMEVWVEARNALGEATSEHINFDPVDRGGPRRLSHDQGVEASLMWNRCFSSWFCHESAGTRCTHGWAHGTGTRVSSSFRASQGDGPGGCGQAYSLRSCASYSIYRSWSLSLKR